MKTGKGFDGSGKDVKTEGTCQGRLEFLHLFLWIAGLREFREEKRSSSLRQIVSLFVLVFNPKTFVNESKEKEENARESHPTTARTK